MMSILVLACVSMLPALVVADPFAFGGCDTNFDNKLDPLFFTKQGQVELVNFGAMGPAKIYLWDPSSAEKTFKNFSVSLNIGSDAIIQYLSATGAEVIITGASSVEIKPKSMIKIKTTANKAIVNVFSFDAMGVADLYPLHISETDVVLMGCNPAFLGRRTTLYLLTNQDYSSLDKACSLKTFNTKFGVTAFATV